jgi:hypothetical protein
MYSPKWGATRGAEAISSRDGVAFHLGAISTLHSMRRVPHENGGRRISSISVSRP